MGADAGGEPGNWMRGGTSLSGLGGSGTGVRGGAVGVSVCAGIFEFPGSSGVAGGAEEIEGAAGFIVLRRTGLCAPATDGIGEPSGSVVGPADDWLREEHFDRDAWGVEEGGGELDGIGGGRGENRGGDADASGSAASVCFAGEPREFGDSDSLDAGGDGWVSDSAADT